MSMSEEQTFISNKRARKLSDKALSASGVSSSLSSSKKAKGNFVGFKKNSSNTFPLRGNVFALPAPLQPCFETKILPSVALSLYDKASQLKLCDDQLVCFGCEGGYRMVRATHGVHRGSYYWEAEILSNKQFDSSTHYRIGWSSRLGELQGPVGFDQHSYGYRSIEGSRVHKSIRIDDYGESYGPGDVIGCFIHLDENEDMNRISFFKNGIDQGIAYSGRDVPSGVYFPAISIYNQGAVRANFGPCFIKRYDIPGANAVSELQPMNSEDRLIHERNIQAIRQARGEV